MNCLIVEVRGIEPPAYADRHTPAAVPCVLRTPPPADSLLIMLPRFLSRPANWVYRQIARRLKTDCTGRVIT